MFCAIRLFIVEVDKKYKYKKDKCRVKPQWEMNLKITA